MGLPTSRRLRVGKADSSGTRAGPKDDSIIASPFMRVARRYLIGGRVQGVGFRYFAEDVARRENVSGWVQNLPDGRVEAAAEGDAESVERFERAIRHGPRGARVDSVEVFDEPPGDRGSGFSVR